jgi:hypothetical protein
MMLSLAEDCGIGKMKVVSNCLNAIRNIDEMPRCPYMMILQEIHEKSKTFKCVRFVHESRETLASAKYAYSWSRSTYVVGLLSCITG